MTTTCTMILGDCLEVMAANIVSKSNFIFADIPYAVSGCAWDVAIDLPTMWDRLAVCAPMARIVFSAVHPLVNQLINTSNVRFLYDLIWHRSRPSGFFCSKIAPLRTHEHLLVFGQNKTYNPQMTQGKKYVATGKTNNGSFFGGRSFKMDRKQSQHDTAQRFPQSVLRFSEVDLRTDHLNGFSPTRIHPTQKPVALLDWLILTYSNVGDMVMDPTSGSGTTAVSACQNGRSVICIEKDEGYFEDSIERVRKHIRDKLLDVKLEVRK